ncbi:MAG: hypothetical protein PHQ02_09550, partial [Candidatus Riflebacteria bacterium]|nr:hypothetical protein [Candidatus Riflebacteria bacterium]
MQEEEIKEIKNFDISRIQNHKKNLIPFINLLNITSKYCVNSANFTICLEKSEFSSKIPDLKNKLLLSNLKSNQETYFKVLLYNSNYTNHIYSNASDIMPCKGIISNQKHSSEKYCKHFNFSMPEKAGISFIYLLRQSRLPEFNELKFDIFDSIFITETEDCFVYNSKVTESNAKLSEVNVCTDSLLFIHKPYKEVLFKYSCDILPVYTRNDIHSLLSSSCGLIEDNFTQKNFNFLEHFGKSQSAQIIKRKATQTPVLQTKIKQNFVILENKQKSNSEKKDPHFKFQTISNCKENYLTYSYKNYLKAEYSLPNISAKLINSTVKFIPSIIKPGKFKNVSYNNLKVSAIPPLKSTVIYSKKDIIKIMGFKTKKHKIFFKGALHAKYTLRATKNIASIKDFRIKYKNPKNNIYIFVEKNKLLKTKSNYEFCFSLPHKRKFSLHDATLKMLSLYSTKSFTKVCFGKNIKKVKQQTPSKFRYFHSQYRIRNNFSSSYKVFETYSFGTTNFIANKQIFLCRKEICNIAKSTKKSLLAHNSYFSNLNSSHFVNDFKLI